MQIGCPYCKGPIDVTKEYILNEDRLCCMSCNKAFSIAEHRDEILKSFQSNTNSDDGYGHGFDGGYSDDEY